MRLVFVIVALLLGGCDMDAVRRNPPPPGLFTSGYRPLPQPQPMTNVSCIRTGDLVNCYSY